MPDRSSRAGWSLVARALLCISTPLRGRSCSGLIAPADRDMSDTIPFNRPHATGNELAYITEAQRQKHLSGDGSFTARCHEWIEQRTGCAKALLTQSCTSALDLAALLLKLEPGDEVIMPSFTFVSTANAFVLRGAVPVFVDIREDTLN